MRPRTYTNRGVCVYRPACVFLGLGKWGSPLIPHHPLPHPGKPHHCFLGTLTLQSSRLPHKTTKASPQIRKIDKIWYHFFGLHPIPLNLGSLLQQLELSYIVLNLSFLVGKTETCFRWHLRFSESNTHAKPSTGDTWVAQSVG